MEWAGPFGRAGRPQCRQPRSAERPWMLLKDAEHVLLAEDQILLVVQGDLGARVLAEEDAVAGLDVERDLLAVVRDLAIAHCDDLALLRLLLGAVRNDDPALLRLLLFLPLDEN